VQQDGSHRTYNFNVNSATKAMLRLVLLLPLAELPLPLWESVDAPQHRVLSDPGLLSRELVCSRGKSFPPNTCRFPLLTFDPVNRKFKWPTTHDLPKEYQGGSVLRYW
jgi:hypothetical protein